MASTTKIMTAIVVLENSNMTDVVTINAKAAGTGGSRLGLKKNDKITVNDLLYGLMLRSGNDAAIALATYVGGSVEGFAHMMNQKAEELGLINSHFVVPHGLDIEGHYTTDGGKNHIVYRVEHRSRYDHIFQTVRLRQRKKNAL